MLEKRIENTICKIERLNMCVDLSEDLIRLVTDNVKPGRVNTFKSHLHGENVFNDRMLKLGRNSKFYTSFKVKNDKIKLKFW